MNNPLQRLKQLPWLPLFWVSLLTLFWASILQLLLLIGTSQFALIANTITILFTPPLTVIMLLAIAMGIGALAVVFLEIVYPQVFVTAGVLWALVLCLLIATLIRSVLPVPSNLLVSADTLLISQLLNPSYMMLVGNMLGVFLKGKPYWR